MGLIRIPTHGGQLLGNFCIAAAQHLLGQSRLLTRQHHSCRHILTHLADSSSVWQDGIRFNVHLIQGVGHSLCCFHEEVIRDGGGFATHSAKGHPWEDEEIVHLPGNSGPPLHFHRRKAGTGAENRLALRKLVAVLCCDLCLTHGIGQREDDGPPWRCFGRLDAQHGLDHLLCEATGGLAHRTDEHIWLVVLDDRNQVCIVIAFRLTGECHGFLFIIAEGAVAAILRFPNDASRVGYHHSSWQHVDLCTQQLCSTQVRRASTVEEHLHSLQLLQKGGTLRLLKLDATQDGCHNDGGCTLNVIIVGQELVSVLLK
mmetsp:Transcript_37316/g.80343  ORF Transcript_37316/g.80343 Transcript_37316/m.80343 type:complete len:314 (-) Transcript_37316:893-1834(-)